MTNIENFLNEKIEDDNINNIINKIRLFLEKSEAKKLLKSPYNKMENVHYQTGHCYVASEVLYHLCGGKEVFSSYSGRDHDNATHWWLKHKKTGKIYDVTADQYYFINKNPPYDVGKPVGFLTRIPSKRAKIIIYYLENKKSINIKNKI